VTADALAPRPSSDERGSEPHAEPAAISGLLDHRTRRRAVPGAAAPGRYLALDGSGETLLIPLETDVTRIGRGLTADLRLDDARVSRRHAIIAKRGSRTRLLDDRSSNGTFVNGRRIFQAELSDGDVIRIGPVVLHFVELS
jgi:pSer/pThr/pTyr-binding forkhead associated (FHA) protein